MVYIRRVTADFSVAPQLTAADITAAAALGFRTLVNNRPDGEAAGQLESGEAEAAARAAGLVYLALPFQGSPTGAVVDETVRLLAAAPGPVLAYCRTGTRSVTAWAMAQAKLGALGVDEIVARAREAGYDLSGLAGALGRPS